MKPTEPTEPIAAMEPIERRAFLVGALAAAPLAAYSPAAGETNPQRKGVGNLVKAGQDRTGRPRNVFGGLHIDAKVTPDDTGGDLYIIEHTDESRGGPPRHVHHEQDEWFYVLKGAYRIDVGDQRFDLGPGDSVFAPRKVPHVWAHVSQGEGRLIIAFQPAGQMEDFLGALAEAGSAPAPETMAKLFAAHGMTLLGPPLELP